MKSIKKCPTVSNNLSKAKIDKDYVVSSWKYEEKLSQITMKKKEKLEQIRIAKHQVHIFFKQFSPTPF